MDRGILVLMLVAGCGKLGFDDVDVIDARINADGVIQRGCVAELSAYGDQVCVRRTDDHVWCWGSNAEGQLGDGSTSDRLVPAAAMMNDAIALTSGENTVCAIRSDHSMACWGDGTLGQLGNGGTANSSVPSAVPLPSAVAEIDSGEKQTCARLADGTGYCWGDNTYAALGIPVSGIEPSPVMSPIGAAKQVSIGDNATCIIQQDDMVACWGRNDVGELGDGSISAPHSTPGAVSGIPETVTQVVGGCHRHRCAVGTSGAVYCWGENVLGQVGTGSTSMYETTARTVAGIPPAARVTVGYGHSCILSRTGEIWCWGDNTGGELGNGSSTSSVLPVRVTSFTGRAVDIQATCGTTHALRDDGTIASWGGANLLGTGQVSDATQPVDVDIPCN